MSKSTRLYTTVSPDLGDAVERLADRRLLSVPDLLRHIISEYVIAEGPLVAIVDERQMPLPQVEN